MLEENDLAEKMIGLAGMSEEPDPLRIQSVRRRMSDLGCRMEEPSA